jgi:hypothetical protein
VTVSLALLSRGPRSRKVCREGGPGHSFPFFRQFWQRGHDSSHFGTVRGAPRLERAARGGADGYLDLPAPTNLTAGTFGDANHDGRLGAKGSQTDQRPMRNLNASVAQLLYYMMRMLKERDPDVDSRSGSQAKLRAGRRLSAQNGVTARVSAIDRPGPR